MAVYDKHLEFACQTAVAAGELAMKYFSNLESLTVHSKGVQDMASDADIETELLIRNEIAKQYAEDAFLGEESTELYLATAGKGAWIVDPIDGTQPFVNGIRSWCISIAYFDAGQVRIGVIYDPTTKELFAAQHGQGSTLNGKTIKASAATSVMDGLVSVGYSSRVAPQDTLRPLERLLHAKGMYHRSGSGALSLAYVAAGRLIGYFEPHMNSWDFAAGILLIKEAGGETNNCLQNEVDLLRGGMVIAACAGVYAELVALVLSRGGEREQKSSPRHKPANSPDRRSLP